MNNRSAWAFLIGSTLLAVVLAAGLAASNLRQAPDLRGQSTTEARAESIAPEVATQIGSRLGDGWRVSAELESLESYRGRFGLPAWQVNYRVVITSPDAPGFRQEERAVRSLGPGARLSDAAQLANAAAYETLASLPAEQRASLLRGIAGRLRNSPLLLVERLSDSLGSRPWMNRDGTPIAHLAELGAKRNVPADAMYVIESAGTPDVSFWGWDGASFVPVAALDPKTGEATPF